MPPARRLPRPESSLRAARLGPRGAPDRPAVRPLRRAHATEPYGADVVDLLSLENSHQVGRGTVMPVDELRGIRKAAQEANVPVYLDGARLFNASVASQTPVEEYAAEVDALMFSLSKGLGAPIGSVLCGAADFVAE